MDTDLEAWVRQEVTEVDRMIQVVVPCTLADPDDPFLAVEEDTYCPEGIVHPDGFLQDHQQLGSWQTCRRLSFYHTLEVFPIRSRAFADVQVEEAPLE